MPRLTRLIIAIVLTVVLGFLGIAAWAAATIQLRLWRNRPIAERIQTLLAPQFPGAVIRAAASYEQDVIGVTTDGPLTDEELARLRSWLKEYKDREQLSVGLLLLAPRSSDGQQLEVSF